MIGDLGGHDTVVPDVGGDPAGWLHEVCDRCGGMVEADAGHHGGRRSAASADGADA